jgi:hypothetical protein
MDRLLALGRGSAEVTDSLDARSIMSAVSISLTLLGESEPVVDEPLA